MIERFIDDYWFLSNFYPIDFTTDGKLYQSVEHYYQSMKATCEKDEKFILESDRAGVARRRGRAIKCRDGWDEMRLVVMEIGLRIKFGHPYLKKRLLETGEEYLQEGNTWDDIFFGVDLRTGEGENHLGILLMKVRQDHREQSDR